MRRKKPPDGKPCSSLFGMDGIGKKSPCLSDPEPRKCQPTPSRQSSITRVYTSPPIAPLPPLPPEVPAQVILILANPPLLANLRSQGNRVYASPPIAPLAPLPPKALRAATANAATGILAGAVREIREIANNLNRHVHRQAQESGLAGHLFLFPLHGRACCSGLIFPAN